jgi:hypothetical protein
LRVQGGANSENLMNAGAVQEKNNNDAGWIQAHKVDNPTRSNQYVWYRTKFEVLKCRNDRASSECNLWAWANAEDSKKDLRHFKVYAEHNKLGPPEKGPC